MLSRDFPVEVLEEILLYSIHVDPPKLSREMRITSLGWNVFLLVNRRWNQSALTCGRAWAQSFTQIPQSSGLVGLRSRGYSRHIEFSQALPAIDFDWEVRKINGVPRHFMGLDQRRQLDDLTQATCFDLITLTTMHTFTCTWPYNTNKVLDSLREMSREQGLVLECLRNLELSALQPRGRDMFIMPLMSRVLGQPLRCPSLRVAHLIDVHVTFISNSLDELSIEMRRMRRTRVALEYLQRVFLTGHAEQVKTLRLVNAFRQDCTRSCADPMVLSRIRHLEISGEFGEAYQFFTRYSPTNDIETLKLDISFDPACDIADFLDRLPFVTRRCNRFHVSMQGDPIGDHGVLRVLAWKGDGSALPVIEDASQRAPADIDLCFRPEMDGPWEWESAVGKCVAFLGNGSHGVLELAFSPFFYLPGRCRWRSMIPHLSTIHYVHPHEILAEYLAPDDEALYDWVNHVQEWVVT